MAIAELFYVVPGPSHPHNDWPWFGGGPVGRRVLKVYPDEKYVMVCWENGSEKTASTSWPYESVMTQISLKIWQQMDFNPFDCEVDDDDG